MIEEYKKCWCLLKDPQVCIYLSIIKLNLLANQSSHFFLSLSAIKRVVQKNTFKIFFFFLPFPVLPRDIIILHQFQILKRCFKRECLRKWKKGVLANIELNFILIATIEFNSISVYHFLRNSYVNLTDNRPNND